MTWNNISISNPEMKLKSRDFYIYDHPEIDDNLYIYVPFTWYLPDVKSYIDSLEYKRPIICLGPGCRLYPEYLKEQCNKSILYNFDSQAIIEKFNFSIIDQTKSSITYTTMGCTLNCPNCNETLLNNGKFIEYKDFSVNPIIADSNFLECSDIHFNRVIDIYKQLPNVYFRHLDIRALSQKRMNRLAELKLGRNEITIAFDRIEDESKFIKIMKGFKSIGIHRIIVLSLINFKEDYDTVKYKLNLITQYGGIPKPLRYNPNHTLKLNEYIAPNWTQDQINKLTNYYVAYESFKNMMSYDTYEQMYHNTNIIRPIISIK
jgi:hypothetical protein